MRHSTIYDMPYTFSMYLLILARKLWQMNHNSPNSPIFPLPKLSRVQYLKLPSGYSNGSISCLRFVIVVS